MPDFPNDPGCDPAADVLSLGRRFRQSVVSPASLGLDKAAHVPAKVPPHTTKGPVRYQMQTVKAGRGEVTAYGSLQRDLAVHLLTNPHHAVVHDRPHVLTTYDVGEDGRIGKVEHVPAFGVAFHDGSVCFVDVRPGVATKAQEAADKVRAAAYREHGALYRCIDGPVVTATPRLPNLKRIREVADANDREAILAVRSLLAAAELPVTIGWVLSQVDLPIDPELDFGNGQYDRGLSATFHLAMLGEVKLDIDRPVDNGTLVTEPAQRHRRNGGV